MLLQLPSKFNPKMIKRLIKGFLGKAGVELSLKKNLWYLDAYEVQRRIVGKPAPLIFDVGASEGSVVSKYKTIYPSAVIHAFEPQPDSFQNLKATTSVLKEVY